MSRFSYADSLTSNRLAPECCDAVEKSLSLVGCKAIKCHPMNTQDGTEYVGKVGMGWAIRILGGLISPATWFPVRLTVTVIEGIEGRRITVTSEEDFGLGSLIGVEKKMRARCDDLEKQITHNLRTRLG